MIGVNKLSVHFTGEYIFDNISFLINSKDRIGLVGKNGAGKTTLLKILAGQLQPETGNVSYPSGSKIGYLPQEIALTGKNTILEETMVAFEEILSLERKISDFSDKLSHIEDYNSQEYSNIIEKLNTATQQYRILGGESIHGEVEKVLSGLGFDQSDFTRNIAEFSGGWQMRVEIAKLLLRKPDLLLLDEPTNHLDIESIQWMEEFLINYKGAVIIVSHDRAFLDNVTQRTIEISLGKIFDYKACYSDYVEMRAERLQSQIATYNNQQKQIEQVERFINRFRYKSTKARQVQSRVKFLEKMDVIEIDETDSSAIRFLFPPAPPSGKVTVDIQHVSKSYEKKQILSDVNLAVTKNEKVAFVGRNGEGKTTLVKIILDQIDFMGNVRLGHNVKIAYYAQNQTELLDMDKTVFQTIDDVAVGDMRPKVRAILGSFLFSGETIDKKVKVLSGGEKSRLALAKMLLEPVNFLILDEPTNHLDMVSKDILKNALLAFDGTLIIVSHDRDFLQGLTEKVYEFKNRNVKQHIGDVYSFLENKKMLSLNELEKKSGTNSKSLKPEIFSDNKLQWEKKKELEKQFRKINNQIVQCEQKIGNLESEIAEMDKHLINPDTYKDFINSDGLFEKYRLLKQQLTEEMELWEKLLIEKENLSESGNVK